MIAVAEDPPQHVLLHNISWQMYENLLHEVAESHVRLTYDEGDLEFMTLSFGHENSGEWIGRLIFFLALELKIPLRSGGSTTLKKALRRKGLEPDKCFWIANEKAMRGKKTWDVLIDPPPDLAVEIDIIRSSLDRRSIYASLGVPEIWLYDGKTFRVLILGASGKYKEKPKSAAFPWLPIPDFARFVDKLWVTDEVSLMGEFLEWVRGEIVANEKTKPGRKSGRGDA